MVILLVFLYFYPKHNGQTVATDCIFVQVYSVHAPADHRLRSVSPARESGVKSIRLGL